MRSCALRRSRAPSDPKMHSTVMPNGRRELLRVLRGEDLGRRHQRRLQSRVMGEHDRRRGDERLAAADIALQQPVHRRAPRHIVRDLRDHPRLRARRLERKLGDEGVIPLRRSRHRPCATRSLALRAFERGRERDAEELFEHDAATSAFDIVRRARRVHGPPCIAHRRKAERRDDRGR